ncbi:unnamed protein product [Allacma fusca]|uniref:Uncharacterized protein n=1 Tax=Allacma fusca TaxID=39272 RepID=A0A8J2JI07_9HEXA|nr:unnamed protein product [Allacma fusca]
MGHNTDNKEEQTPRTPFPKIAGIRKTIYLYTTSGWNNSSWGDVFSNLAGENLVEQGESFTKIIKPEVPDSDNNGIVDLIEEENEPLDKSETVHETDGGNEDSKKSGCFSRTRKSIGKFFRRLFPGFRNVTVFSCCNASVL